MPFKLLKMPSGPVRVYAKFISNDEAWSPLGALANIQDRRYKYDWKCPFSRKNVPLNPVPPKHDFACGVPAQIPCLLCSKVD